MPKSLAHQDMAPGQCCNTEVQLVSDHFLTVSLIELHLLTCAMMFLYIEGL